MFLILDDGLIYAKFETRVEAEVEIEKARAELRTEADNSRSEADSLDATADGLTIIDSDKSA